MTLRRQGRFGVGAVLPLVLVAGFAVASLTGLAAGDAHADDAALELVSIEAGSGKTNSCVGISTADGSSCLDQSAATRVASTVADEDVTPKVKKNSCPRASK